MSKQEGFILIVEDTADIQQLMAALLESEGYRVLCAGNGKKALEAVRSMTELPRVILLDLMMPVMDGHEFLAERKKDECLKNIPVVMMSADIDISAKARKLGVDAHLKKPFLNLNEILTTVSRYF